jgi:hypothetical protein
MNSLQLRSRGRPYGLTGRRALGRMPAGRIHFLLAVRPASHLKSFGNVIYRPHCVSAQDLLSLSFAASGLEIHVNLDLAPIILSSPESGCSLRPAHASDQSLFIYVPYRRDAVLISTPFHPLFSVFHLYLLATQRFE